MSSAGLIKSSDKAIRTYYAALQSYGDQQVTHEGALETAFQRLLADTARPRGWMLVPKFTVRVGGKHVIPDGTLRDEFNLHRGYWEAKDTDDDLNVEVRKKIDAGYPLSNTIFEDTRRAVLFQNGQQAMSVELSDAEQLASLLNAFYAHTEPDIEGFEQAVTEFKERVPELAHGLAGRISQAHQENVRFQAAFADFFALCQSALNPNLSQAAADEMLVQHLLTERLIRTVFDQDNFARQNAIAAEVEKVIDALAGQSFSRKDFLKSLDRFYRAIEAAARALEDFSDKQRFLNTVYERFFQGYSVKVADTHGIVYTPQAIVDFMCASVGEVLQSEFGRGLGDKDVHILDPCTGTGNFIVNLLRRIPKKHLPRMYRQQLFANEVMLLPYYIAALNIERAYYELTGAYESFEGLCFVDTLELAEKQQQTFHFMSEENTQRVVRQKNAPITVIVGNPPYNVGQLNENDNNKNRRYKVVDDAIRQTYAKDSTASLKTKLYDPYVKFFRWAIDRLNGRDGIVCFVSNNSFVHKNTFDGMRKHLLRDFTRVYHLDLRGDVKIDSALAGTTFNVFGIQVGVGITIAIRKRTRARHRVYYCSLPKTLRKEEKYAWLNAHSTVGGVRWKPLQPDARNTWLVPANRGDFCKFASIGAKAAKASHRTSVETVFKTYSLGVSTNRDRVAYAFDSNALQRNVTACCENYNQEVDRYKRCEPTGDIDDFVRYEGIKWSLMLKNKLKRHRYATYDATKVRRCLYRPFAEQFLFFDDVMVDARGLFPSFYPTTVAENENRTIVLSDIGYRAQTFSALMSRTIADLHLCAAVDGHQCFPFYVYDEDGSNRRENVTDWALALFRERYKNRRISKWDVFYYVYCLLHHRGYREKFAENLQRELPRIPLAADFRGFSQAGRELGKLHVQYEQLEPYPLDWIETPGRPLSYRVEKMKLSKDKTSLTVNHSLTLAGIPRQTLQYRLGNRSALEWVVDQYRVTEDQRSGIRSDPNRVDDPDYIVRLVGQVVRVGVETMRIVDALPGIEST